MQKLLISGAFFISKFALAKIYQSMDHQKIFSITSKEQFEEVALEVFRFQYKTVPVYNQFSNLLKKTPANVKQLKEIPFLPIQFFKSHKIVNPNKDPEIIFTSSGTTGSNTSSHLVPDLSLYEDSFVNCFNKFYGEVEDYVILALLPSYLEREGSSLIYMADNFIKRSKHPESGFYLNNLPELREKLLSLDNSGKKILLLGVSFALLDLVESSTFQLTNTTIMETGGMKGRRMEMIREELHGILKNGFGLNTIHSEYGMTELLSQAYSKGNGIFNCPPWMDILIRDPEDALHYPEKGKTGGINVIDLANLYSCSFIATQDLGKIKAENEFEILGRFDNSDIRGCNLMVI